MGSICPETWTGRASDKERNSHHQDHFLRGGRRDARPVHLLVKDDTVEINVNRQTDHFRRNRREDGHDRTDRSAGGRRTFRQLDRSSVPEIRFRRRET